MVDPRKPKKSARTGNIRSAQLKKKKKKKVVKKVVAKQVLPKRAPVFQPVIKLEPTKKKETITRKDLPPKKVKIRGGSAEFRRAAGLPIILGETKTLAQRNAELNAIKLEPTPKKFERKTDVGRAIQGAKNIAGFIKRKLFEPKFGFTINEAGERVPKEVDLIAQPVPFGIGRGVTLTRRLSQIGKRINVDALGKTAGLSKAQTKALAVQIGRERINVLARYAVNPKSAVLTTGFFLKLGLTVAGASLLKDAIGTYPFAGFLKEEAVQTLGFGFNVARQAGDIEGMQAAVDMQREIVEAGRNIVDLIPYANVQKQVKQFMEAAAVSLEIFQREIDSLKAGGESGFEQTRRESDEAARVRSLEAQQIDAEYFRLIREGKFDEAQELLDTELKAARTTVAEQPTTGQPKPELKPIKL